MTVDIPELRIEEKSALKARRDQQAPSGHSVNIDVISTTLFDVHPKNCRRWLACESGIPANKNVG
ncbi:hypothetical protein [Pseudomonas sp. NFX15]|uniref:hypothetical protein n=1 Tax=Pseudomonas sp. NFX15 TaxID=2816958 RepID=UPI003B8E180E